jgi:PST family polysaccharide transporter
VSKLFKNIGFLTISQAANYIIPLITIPYITRTVGPDIYGWVEFGIVAMLYFSAVIIFGFNTTGTRRVAEHPDDMKKVSKDFSSIVSTRLFLLVLTSLIFVIGMFTIPKFQEQSKLMWYAFPIVIGWAMYPEFLFQGLQKLQVVAIANFVVKDFLFCSIFYKYEWSRNFL